MPAPLWISVLSHGTKNGDHPITFASGLTNAEKSQRKKYWLWCDKDFQIFVRMDIHFIDWLPPLKESSFWRQAYPICSCCLNLKLGSDFFQHIHAKSNIEKLVCILMQMLVVGCTWASKYVDPPVLAKSVLLLKQSDDSLLTRHLFITDIENVLS